MKLENQVPQRLGALIHKGEEVLGTEYRLPSNYIGFPTYVNRERYFEWKTQSLVCLAQVFGDDHNYTSGFASSTENDATNGSVTAGLGILRAALEDVERGHLAAIQELAAADIFLDFLEQADHLLSLGYSAPAASLAGAVLENGLRSLAERNCIAVKARDDLSALNSKIAAKSVYNRLRQKQIAVWIDVRNAADHGRFDDFRESDVADLIKGARDFFAEQM